MLSGDCRRVDLGRADNRYFLLMAGIGLDGAIVARMTPGFKRRFGAWSYFVAGIPLAFISKPSLVRLTIDGTVTETTLYWMVIGNTRSYGGFRDITHRAIADDGKLDVALMRRGGVRNLLFDGVRLLRGRHDRSPNIRYLRAQNIEVESASIPVQVDGEVHARTPMRFEVAPGALNVIVPRASRSPLFTVGAAVAGVTP
jgi:diacylglycerol kinase family enzyme